MQLPLNVSPVSASFIGLQRQGIHLVLCRACSHDSFISVLGVLWQSLFQRCRGTDLLRFLCFSLALGKIEEKMIQLFMCKVLVPQHLESGKQPWLLCEKQVLFDLGVPER